MENYIDALKKVPETKLAIIALAWQIVKPDGTLDENQVVFYHTEVMQAVKESQSYASDTKKAVESLCSLAHLNPWEIDLQH